MDDLPAQIMGLTFDSKGNMFVATYENQAEKRILKITHDGTISTMVSFECFAFEYIKTDRNDSLYASVILISRKEVQKYLKYPGMLKCQ